MVLYLQHKPAFSPDSFLVCHTAAVSFRLSRTSYITYTTSARRAEAAQTADNADLRGASLRLRCERKRRSECKAPGIIGTPL